MIEYEAGRLFVQGSMKIQEASSLLSAGRACLKAHLPSKEPLIVDLSRVVDADASALALIFAWMRSASALGFSLVLAHLPQGLSSQAKLYGLADLLPIDVTG